MSFHQIVLILVVASLFDPIYSRALKAGSENSSSSSSSSNSAQRRGGGEFFDPNGYSLGFQGPRGRSALSAPLLRPTMGRYRYGYFDRQARAMVKVEVEPMIMGRTEYEGGTGYGTVNSPLYTYAPGYGPSYTSSEYGSSVPSGGTYGGASYTVQDTNPYGYQDTAASEYIVSGSSDPYGMYGDQGYAYQGNYGDGTYSGSYDSSMQSSDLQPSGYAAAHTDGSYEVSSQQVAVSGADPSQTGSTYDNTGTGSGTSSGSSSSSSSSSYRNNNGYNRNGSQGNNDQMRPSRTFYKR